jgi:outer membrane cobalamin receptor
MDFLAVDGGSISAVLSPRVGVVWPRVWGVWRLSLGRGFRSPTLAERFVRTSALGFEVIPNPTLVPETSWSFELGNTAPVSERLRIDIAGFWTEARRLIEPAIMIDEAGGGVPRIQFQNVSRALLAGVDVVITASPITERLSGTLAYTWLHARERARDMVPERPLAFRPRHLLTLSGDYGVEPFSIGADWRYTSRIDRVEIYPDDPRIAAVVLDLRASYRRAPLEIHARVANALNHIHSLVPRTLAPVRTATVTLTWTY